LDNISQRPEEYSELLQPWKEPFGSTGRHWAFAYGFPTGFGPLDSDDASGHSWEVFQRQWARWQNFRIWQRDNRCIEDDDDGFPTYVEWCKDYLKRYRGVGRDVTKKLAKLADIESDPSILKDERWDRALWNRQEQQRFCREQHDGVEFADYVNAVKRRLARHGFTRPFELKEDPKQQDNLSTWIEYLGFEYWWLDRYMDTIDRLKPSYDKAWQTLVDSEALRPHETQEYVPTDECGMQRDTERHKAWDAYKRAHKHAEQVYKSTQLDSNRLSIPEAERCRRLQAASQKLQMANAWVSSTEKRDKLIHEYNARTSSTRRAKKDAARHCILLVWILEQISLIEAELGQTEMVQHGSGTAKRNKKRPYPDEDKPVEQETKKRKLSYSGLSDASAVFDRFQHPLAESTSAVSSSRTLPNSKTGLRRPRRSARIATRQTTAGVAPTFQSIRRELRPRRQNKPIKASRPLSTAESTCSSTIECKDARRGSQQNAYEPQGVSKGRRIEGQAQGK
jgi:hypothetical protein